MYKNIHALGKAIPVSSCLQIWSVAHHTKHFLY